MVAAAASAPGRRFDGRYLVLGELGRGGMGAVFRVLDEATGEERALKQMSAPAAGDAEAAELRFRREFHTMASLRHPRIVSVHDYGVADGMPYYTLELLDGEDLHDVDRVPTRRACELLRDVATALAFLHARRLLHRDLATRNVRCTSDGRAKLIDFGVLATAGIAGEVAGTPPYMAPETLRGLPLDHRADLFGLGAQAYRILTGKHAYPARTIDELETMWRRPPPPPSASAPGIPPELDALVMSLLAIDSLARPVSAVEVVDRLTAIGGLDPATDLATTHGWIASAALVGRRREVGLVRRAVVRTDQGDGRAVLIEAPSGIGKTRMLRELELEAQLGGLAVIRAGADAADRGPYGVVHELARVVFATAPDEAEDAARPRGSMLVRVLTDLRERIGASPAPPAGDPAEDRMRLQGELAAWFVEVATRRSLAIVVDDIQRCDEASAAVLATLAHATRGSRLMVAAALRTDEAVRAPAAVAALCDAGQRIRLRGLDEAQVGELCESLFGTVEHVPRLARWMHRIAGGSPLHSLELARHLVDTEVIRYVDGAWIIPEQFGADDNLPRELAGAMDARICSLPVEARALAEVLSVHGGRLELSVIVSLANAEPEQVFAALDQLAFDEVLIHSGDHWRFRHDGIREALLRNLDDTTRHALHRRVGEVLLREAEHGPERHVEIGWHLLRGGDVARGAKLLEAAGRALYDAQSFSDCIAPLEAALAANVRRSPRCRLELLQMLLMAGSMADRKAALRHADACVAGYRKWAGIGIAVPVSRVLGRYVGVAVGMLCATVRWLVGLCRGPGPYEAFRTFFISVGYASTIHSLGFDLDKMEEMVGLVRPIAILPNRIPYAVYLLICNLLHFPRGEMATTRANAIRLLEILEHDRITPIREIDRRTGGGGAQYMLALMSVMNLEDDREERLAGLQKLGLRFFEMGADQARIVMLRMCGEEDRAVELASTVEVKFVQLGSIWQIEAFMPVISGLAYGLTRDMLGLRRTIEQLAAMCADGFKYDGFLALTRGEYLRERGDAAAAIAVLSELVDTTRSPMVLTHALPALAEAHLAAEDVAAARTAAERALARASSHELYNLQVKVRAIRVLALAEAALGDRAAAHDRLEKALADTARHDSPLINGSLHEARARIAVAMRDSLAYHEHLARAQQWYRQTRNPVLVARVQRLEALAGALSRAPTATTTVDGATEVSSPRRRVDAVSIVGADAVTTPHPEASAQVSAVLSACRGAHERAARVLELLVAETRGASGYLYLKKGGGLTLVAPSVGDEPPTSLRDDLARELARAPGTADEGATTVDRPKRETLVVPLVFVSEAGSRIEIGVAAIYPGGLPMVEADPVLVEEIARELFDAGDVTIHGTVGMA